MSCFDPDFWQPYTASLPALIEARAAYEQAQVWGEVSAAGQAALEQAGFALYRAVETLGWGPWERVRRLPGLIADCPWLVTEYQVSLAHTLEIRDEMERDQAEWREEQATQACRQQARAWLDAEDWAALDLPSPAAFLAELHADEGVEIHGHTFFIDEDMEGQLVCTNDYGVDAYPGVPATIAGLTRVLRHLALGGTYGERDDWD